MSYVSIDIDIWDALAGLSDRETRDVCKDLIEGGYAPEGFAMKSLPPLEDNILRLECITWLRANGWTVEPK